MHAALEAIPSRIFRLAEGALAQANTHAVYADHGKEYWDFISIINAGHAGELFIKAVIAQEHPLLIFKDLFLLDDKSSDDLNIEDLIQRGKTYELNSLPQVLWVTTGYRIKEIECFERLRKVRNAIQHFCDPDTVSLRSLSLEFIYKIIDPLIAHYFGVCAIEYHEDPSVSYDYVVMQILSHESKFTMPKDFNVTEISIKEALEGCDETYRSWVRKELRKIGRLDLYG
jgi:hypothetical protein